MAIVLVGTAAEAEYLCDVVHTQAMSVQMCMAPGALSTIAVSHAAFATVLVSSALSH
jgi:hypothetical protein